MWCEVWSCTAIKHHTCAAWEIVIPRQRDIGARSLCSEHIFAGCCLLFLRFCSIRWPDRSTWLGHVVKSYRYPVFGAFEQVHLCLTGKIVEPDHIMSIILDLWHKSFPQISPLYPIRFLVYPEISCFRLWKELEYTKAYSYIYRQIDEFGLHQGRPWFSSDGSSSLN